MDKTDKKKTTRVKTAVRMPSNQSSDVIVRKVTKPRVKKMTAHKETHPTDYHEMKHKEGKSESESDEKEKKPRKPRVKKERSEEQREADKERMKKLREMRKKKE
jgi:hypothetical protein